VVLGIGCQASQQKTVGHELTGPEALALAVDLANKECNARYSTTPFNASSYPITFRDGLWHWGILDHAGYGGFSAIVTFDSRGEKRTVEVFLSTDEVLPLR